MRSQLLGQSPTGSGCYGGSVSADPTPGDLETRDKNNFVIDDKKHTGAVRLGHKPAAREGGVCAIKEAPGLLKRDPFTSDLR